METNKKKIWFFRYDTWQHIYVYLPLTWYGFKRYYELNGEYSNNWDFIPPVVNYENWSIDDIIDEAISHNADVYMFSSYVWSWPIINIVAFNIKQALPNSIIILGGPHQHTTYSEPEEWFSIHPYFDAVCRPLEYGEFFIMDMLDSLSTSTDIDWNNVRGSYHRNGAGRVGNKKEFVYPPDLVRSNIDNARKSVLYAKTSNKLVGIMYETDRGCPFSCVYCEWGGGTNSKIVVKDLASIKDDVSFFRELNIHTVWFTDANYGILPRDVEISKLFAEQNDFIEYIGITGLAKTTTEKKLVVLEPLVKSGLVPVYQVSIQTIDQNTLKNVERTDITYEENLELARYLMDTYDIDVVVELILGFPGLTVDTFYKETAIEYQMMKRAKNNIHHNPLYILPDSPVADPLYLEKFKMKIVPICLEDSSELIDNSANSMYLKTFNSKEFNHEPIVHIPVCSYSYTVEDWKEMFFMNDMNYILINKLFLKPFSDFLHYNKNIPLELIFKKIFTAISKVDNFYSPIYNRYLTPLSNGEFLNKSWREFNIGPISGSWAIIQSYIWLWITYKDEIYMSLFEEFNEYLDASATDCLFYCKNSTFSDNSSIIWDSLWRWDLWEESRDKSVMPLNETIMLITKNENINWYATDILRNQNSYRFYTDEKIHVETFKVK
jgi:radical SAM superfamily enzyme YgiQ (UPF0313 family)